MYAPKGMEQGKKALYSEEFQAMLDRIEEEDYVERSGEACMRSKSRLCTQQVKALEKHFEVENKLQPERKLRIAEELGLEPRQVAVWFQNRRARWRTKHLEKEYDMLRTSYAALKHDYGSLEQEKQALLEQLKELKAKIEARTPKSSTTPSIPSTLNSGDVSNESTSLNVQLPVSSASSSGRPTFDPFPMASSSSMSDGFQLWKASQNQLVRMEDMGIYSNEESCNIFSVDQAPTLHWHHSDQFD